MKRRKMGTALVSAVAMVGLGMGTAGCGAGVTTNAAANATPGVQPVALATPKADKLEHAKLKSGATMPYYGAYPLTGSSKPTEAVIVVHGSGRDAEAYFDRMVKASSSYGSKVEVVAPWFQTDEEHSQSGDVYWTNGDNTSWKDGGDSVSPKGISSFDVMDEIVSMLGDKSKFPNISKLVITGHSAGGQFTQRYAIGGQAPDTVKGLSYKFVAANPSSYMYFDSKRPAKIGSDCKDSFNDYKYGLDKRNRYMGKLTGKQLQDQYEARKFVYLLGEADTENNHGMDDSCEGYAQGPYRLARGKSYYATDHKQFPDAPHTMVTVPGIGHDGGAMFNSDNGKKALFSDWS